MDCRCKFFFNSANFDIICSGDNIVTYDFENLRFEITKPNGFTWRNISNGVCGRYKDDIYCWSGLNCTNFQEVRLWTRYNIPTNTLYNLSSEGLINVRPRDSASVTCIESKGKCLIGAGHVLPSPELCGALDDWEFYDVELDKFESLDPKKKPLNMEYITPDISRTWNITNNDFVVVEEGDILLIGGDNSSCSIPSSDSVRYLATFDYDKIKFKEYKTGDLFTIKQQKMKNIPKIIDNNNQEDESKKNCNYWIEYGGFEHNPEVPEHVPNEVVLYKLCS
jgi:hypothetical protein